MRPQPARTNESSTKWLIEGQFISLQILRHIIKQQALGIQKEIIRSMNTSLVSSSTPCRNVVPEQGDISNPWVHLEKLIFLSGPFAKK